MKEAALKFIAECKKLGWSYNTKESIITISKSFTPGDMDAFVDCDSEYYSILSLAPLKGGSIWGTDGGGIGAISAIKNGLFVMNKSGNTGKRFLRALEKI